MLRPLAMGAVDGAAALPRVFPVRAAAQGACGVAGSRGTIMTIVGNLSGFAPT